MQEIEQLLKKYNNFKDARIDSAHQGSDGSIELTLITQDDDGEDLDSVTILFNDIKKSRLLQNHVLGYLDMMSGITIIKENNLYGFALGSGTAMLHVHNAPMYIISEQIKIKN